MSAPVSYTALVAARSALADVESRLGAQQAILATATAELAEAEAALTKQRGAAALGESDATALGIARGSWDAGVERVASVRSALAMLDERLRCARETVIDAEAAFRLEAAALIQPAYEQSCDTLRQQAEALAHTFIEHARLATVARQVPHGVLGGESLLRLAGSPLEYVRHACHVDIILGFARAPQRFTETEVLERLQARRVEAAK